MFVHIILALACLFVIANAYTVTTMQTGTGGAGGAGGAGGGTGGAGGSLGKQLNEKCVRTCDVSYRIHPKFLFSVLLKAQAVRSAATRLDCVGWETSI